MAVTTVSAPAPAPAASRSHKAPYGYGWLLALAQELKQSSLPQAERWYQTLQPLTRDIRQRLVDYLSKLTYPIRVGTHYNTAFALALGLDYADDCFSSCASASSQP